MTVALLLLVFITAVTCQGFSLSYKTHQYTFGTQRRSSLVFNTIFDQDTFVSSDTYNCWAEYNLDVSDCCTSSSSLGCFEPSQGHLCLGSTPMSEVVQLTTSNNGYIIRSYQLQINNPYSSYGSLSIHSDIGVAYMNAYYIDMDGVYHNATSSPTTNAVTFCGTQFHSSAPIVLNVDIVIFHKNPPVMISYTLQVDNALQGLPMSKYYSLASASIYLSRAAVPFPCSTLHGHPNCNPLIPVSSDILYESFNRAVLTNPLPRNSRVYNWEYIISIDDTVTGEHFEVFSPDMLLDGSTTVSVQFSNVYGASQNPLDSVVLAKPISTDCSYSGAYFNRTVQELNTAQDNAAKAFPSFLDTLSLPINYDPVELNAFWLNSELVAPTVKDNWLHCFDFMKSNLLISQLSTTAHPIKECKYLQGTPEYDSDPCCNYLLLSTQCCAFSVYNETSAIYSTSNHIGQYCPANGISNAQGLLRTFVLSQPESEMCLKDLQDLNPVTVAGIYDSCYDQLTGSYCSSDTDCVELFGENTFCSLMPGTSASMFGTATSKYPLRTCKWMCDTDADCFYGSCINMGHWSECHFSPTEDPYLNLNIANQLSSCIAKQILSSNQFFQKSFKMELNLTIDQFTESNIQQAIYHDTVSLSDCSISYFPGDHSFYPCGTEGKAYGCNWQSYLTDVQNPGGIDDTFCLKTDNNVASTSYCSLTPYERAIVFPDVSQGGDCYLLPTFDNFGASIIPQWREYSGCYYESPEESGVPPASWGNALKKCNWQNSPVIETDCLLERFCPASLLIPINSTFGLSYKDRPPTLINGKICLPRCIAMANLATCEQISNAAWVPEGGFCEFPATTAQECNKNLGVFINGMPIGVYWWKGSFYLPAQFQSSCQSFCLSDPTKSTKSSCDSATYCSNPLCPSCISTCTSTGYCSALPGCYFPLDGNNSCPVELIKSVFPEYTQNLPSLINWTPYGCTVTFPGGFTPITPHTCSANGGTYLSYSDWVSLTPDACHKLVPPVCKVAGLNAKSIYSYLKSQNSEWVSHHHPPPGITFTGSKECTACGGQVRNAFEWIPGSLIKNPEQWINLRPRDRATIPQVLQGAPWKVIQRDHFLKKYVRVDYYQQLLLAKQISTCSWSTVSQVLGPVTCLCPGSNTTSNSECAYTPIAGTFTVCSSLPQVIHKHFGRIIVNKTFVLIPDQCIDITVKNDDQYKEVRDYSLMVFDTGRNFNTQTGRERNLYIKNSHSIIVGQLLSDGTTFQTVNGFNSFEGVSLCLFMPDNTSSYPMDQSHKFTARNVGRVLNLNGTYGPFEILDVPMIYSDEVLQGCFPLDTRYTYFPIALVEDSLRAQTYKETIDSSDYVVIIGAIVVYSIAIVVSWIAVAIDFKITKECHFNNWVKPSALLFTMAFALRIGYCVWLASDPSHDVISVFFIELPSLILWTLTCLLLARWIGGSKKAEYSCSCSWSCFTTTFSYYLYFAVIGNLIMYIIYLAIILSYSNKPLDWILSSSQYAMAYAWYIVFILFCLFSLVGLFFVMFVILGGRIPFESNQLKQVSLVALGCSLVVFVLYSFILGRTFLWKTGGVDKSPFSGWALSGYLAALVIIDVISAVLLMTVSWPRIQLEMEYQEEGYVDLKDLSEKDTFLKDEEKKSQT